MTRAILIATALVLTGCTDRIAAERTLIDAGYSDVTLSGPDIFTCGDWTSRSATFRATNPIGKPVKGVVCCGFAFKGCTIRH